MAVCKKLWFNAEVDLKGAIQPCSSFNGTIACTPYDIDSYFASADLSRCIQDHQAGRQNLECAVCWEQEAQGHRSLRQSIDEVLPALTDQPKLLVLDYSLDHLCNLKCIMCNEEASSAIMAEKIALGQKVIPIRLKKDQTRLDFLKKHIKSLHELKIYNSGEPLMSPLLEPLINLIKDQNPNIKLLISTNGTQVNEKNLELLRLIKNLTVKISIDGFDTVNSLIRYPSRWEEIDAGIDQLRTLSDARLIVHTAVQALNLYQLDKLLVWAKEKQVDIELAPVNRVPWLEIQVIPMEVREIYKSKIVSILKSKSNLGIAIMKNLLVVLKRLEHEPFCEQSHGELKSFLDTVSKFRQINLENYIPEELTLLKLSND